MYLVIVQCRFSSERLPGKVLYPLGNIPLLCFLLKRLKASLDPSTFQIVLATTTMKEDNAVATWGEVENVHVVRGEANDVLTRYARCLDLFPFRYVIRVTADNPLTCPILLENCASHLSGGQFDYVQIIDAPVGAGVDGFSASALTLSHREAVSADEREHVNLYLLNNAANFNLQTIRPPASVQRPELSVTIDTLDDWKKLSSIFKHNEKEPWNISLHEAIMRMDSQNLR
jgi:spore coat polysaccharide biosynthesis protein SpsF